MQEPRNSCVVAAKTKDRERRAVPAVARVVMKVLWKKATGDALIQSEGGRWNAQGTYGR